MVELVNGSLGLFTKNSGNLFLSAVKMQKIVSQNVKVQVLQLLSQYLLKHEIKNQQKYFLYFVHTMLKTNCFQLWFSYQ